MELLRRVIISFIALLSTNIAFGQTAQPSSSEILLKLKKLNVLGSALYFAAHPDDENTRLIGYLSNGELVNTAYLALTRGDGGQNLIGAEMREGLGLIRTQELLAARSVDGSTQFFSRANDFGYSKTAKETLEIWDRDQVLHDAVWTIRKFRPDVIITRFPPDSRAGHGHHTSSAIIAAEAFAVAATKEYPDQLKSIKPWQPTRLMMNTGRWWNPDIEKMTGVIKVDVGGYNSLLGESYTETAARSRSMHKSQGFGSQGSRGSSFEYLSVEKGLEAKETIFEGIDITWGRVGNPAISKDVDAIIESFDPSTPQKSINALAKLHSKVSGIKDDFWRSKKLAEIEQLIIDCSGLFLSAWSSEYAVVPGSTLPFTVEAVNRTTSAFELSSIHFDNRDTLVNAALKNNQKLLLDMSLNVDPERAYSGPYWLEKEPTLGMYTVDDLNLIGLPQNPAAFSIRVSLKIENIEITREIPLVYHWTDRVNGEMKRPVTIVPPAYVNLSNPVYIFKNGESKTISVAVEAAQNNLQGTLRLNLPGGWVATPSEYNVSIPDNQVTKSFEFSVVPSSTRSGAIEAVITVDGKDYNRAKQDIQYLHIPYQIMLPRAVSRAENLNVINRAQTVGYVMGAGDNVPEGLEQMGIKVWLMSESDITSKNLATLDAVIFGIRAVNTLAWIPAKKPELMEYMEKGGTVIMQYNTTRGLNWNDFAPYELNFTGRSSDSRVAEEDAAVTILQPSHKVLNFPNKITENDFAGWVQERGLYFPSDWDEKYEAVISMHDEGEEAKEGSLLIAEYGNGHFVYSGISWFRELPAGVPGAYRLFSNILSISAQVKSQPDQMEKKEKRRANR